LFHQFPVLRFPVLFVSASILRTAAGSVAAAADRGSSVGCKANGVKVMLMPVAAGGHVRRPAD